MHVQSCEIAIDISVWQQYDLTTMAIQCVGIHYIAIFSSYAHWFYIICDTVHVRSFARPSLMGEAWVIG